MFTKNNNKNKNDAYYKNDQHKKQIFLAGLNIGAGHKLSH